MVIIACVDEKNGLMFNHRRQSRDLAVCQDILRMCEGKNLYMSEYSGRLFEGMKEEENGIWDNVQVKVTDDFLKQAGKEDVCFAEDIAVDDFKDQIQEVVLYKWNRRYPADQYFPLDLSDGPWEICQMEEFKGSSHERITKEVYKRIR